MDLHQKSLDLIIVRSIQSSISILKCAKKADDIDRFTSTRTALDVALLLLYCEFWGGVNSESTFVTPLLNFKLSHV